MMSIRDSTPRLNDVHDTSYVSVCAKFCFDGRYFQASSIYPCKYPRFLNESKWRSTKISSQKKASCSIRKKNVKKDGTPYICQRSKILFCGPEQRRYAENFNIVFLIMLYFFGKRRQNCI